MTKKEVMIRSLKDNNVVHSKNWVENNEPLITKKIKEKYNNINYELAEYIFENNFIHIILDKHRYRQYAFDLIVEYDKISLDKLELYFACIPQRMNYCKEVN